MHRTETGTGNPVITELPYEPTLYPVLHALIMESQSIYEAVTSHYSAISQKAPRNEGKYGKAVAKAFGYTTEELDAIPADANLGLSCGNPFTIASLKEVGWSVFHMPAMLTTLAGRDPHRLRLGGGIRRLPRSQ